MTFRRLVVGLALTCLALGASGLPSTRPVAAAGPAQNVSSESYYRLDVAAGTMSVHVDATITNVSNADLATAVLWAMPRSQNLAVMADSRVLATRNTTSANADVPMTVVATLPSPLKRGGKVDLTVDYDVPTYVSKYVHMEPGDLEVFVVSQGMGSFVYLDVPAKAENYLDPGCLKASDQPKAVRESGLERWVCGDAAIIALSTDRPEIIKKCSAGDDRCRQQLSATPFSAFVQSITDESQRGTLEADVNLQHGPVKLILKFFRRDQAWADKQFAVAQAALLPLERVFGFPYPGKQILMLESHHIEMVGAAGVAFPDQGQVLLATGTGFDEEVTVHELAHQWAGTNLSTNWLWEGLAEFGMRSVAAGLGIKPIDRRWQSFPFKDPLATWYNGSPVDDPDYWYGKAGAFWFAYQQAIGGADNMRGVLAQTSPDTKHEPFDGKWFMDAGEAVSGANLDSLFLSWVFNPLTATGLLQDRRAAHDLVNTMNARATSMGLAGTPADIQESLDAWLFAGVADQVKTGGTVLDAYATVLQATTDAGLAVPDAVAKSWGTAPLARTRGVIEDQRQAVIAITGSATKLAAEAEGSPALGKLADAKQKFTEGRFDAAKQLAANAITTAFNEVAAGKMMNAAKAKQAEFKPSFLSRVGLLFSDPDGDLAEAQRAFEAGDPNRAVELSKSAYEAWDSAESRGLQMLAMLAGVMCGLSGLVWYLLHRMDRHPLPAGASKSSAAVGGHNIGDPDARRSSWRDWENTP